MRCTLLAVAMSVLLSGNTMAVDAVSERGSGNWLEENRWETGVVPAGVDFDVFIATGGRDRLTINSQVEIGELRVGHVLPGIDGGDDFSRNGGIEIFGGQLSSQKTYLGTVDIDSAIFIDGRARGTAIISGSSSAWNNSGAMLIGYGTTATVDVLNGGTVSNGGAVTVGATRGFIGRTFGNGTLRIIGDGSAFSAERMTVGIDRNRGSVVVAERGRLSLSGDIRAEEDLSLRSGGIVQAENVIIDGGRLTVGGEGRIEGNLELKEESILEVGIVDSVSATDGALLTVTGTAELNGVLSLRSNVRLSEPGSHSITVLEGSAIEGSIAPPLNEHYGAGQFFQGINVSDSSVSVDIFQAAAGDANGDGVFNSLDLLAVLEAGEFEDEVAANSSWTTGDWNLDGDFNREDIVAALTSGSYQQGPFAATVPEPDSILSALVACLFLVASRRSPRSERYVEGARTAFGSFQNGTTCLGK